MKLFKKVVSTIGNMLGVLLGEELPRMNTVIIKKSPYDYR